MRLSDVQCRGLVAICEHAGASAVEVRTPGDDSDNPLHKTPGNKKIEEFEVLTFEVPNGWDKDGYRLRPSGRWAPSGTDQWREPHGASVT